VEAGRSRGIQTQSPRTDLKERVKVAFASGSEELNRKLIERFGEIAPELPLYVVSEFPPDRGHWIPYHVLRSFWENLARLRAHLRHCEVRYAAILLDPDMPMFRMRLMSLLLFPFRTLIYNEDLNHYMLRPRAAGAIMRHFLWRLREWFDYQFHPGGDVYTFYWRLGHPGYFRRPLAYMLAVAVGKAAALVKALLPSKKDPDLGAELPDGITVVIPSRNGRGLLERLLPGVRKGLGGVPSEIIVVDNGSIDGTVKWLAEAFPEIRVESCREGLGFSAAVNRGIRLARFSKICLLNNDMEVQDGFFSSLRAAFDAVPELFCATAQILFPPGARREETGKAVMPPREPFSRSTEFPIRCEEPLEGENHSYVLYGSGGCSLYDTRKLRCLGGLGEMYRPAYVEDLDIGYRAWLRGWPTVYVAGAKVIHYHRATTSRYYTAEELDLVLDVNYLRFLMRSVVDPAVFSRLWRSAIWRLNLLGAGHYRSPVAEAALLFAVKAWRWIERPPRNPWRESLILGLGSGDVAVFPGRRSETSRKVLVVSPYLPYPLSHGGAVRMYNLMRRAARDFGQILISFVEELRSPPAELLEICDEIVLVRRQGTHLRPSTSRPDVVEEFDVAAFHAAVQQTVRKWSPDIAQLEFTQMAQYAPDCHPAKTVLVEHDITVDLYRQLLAQGEDWDLKRQLQRWERFERTAWTQVDCVVTMSEKDRAAVASGRAEVLPNGVDLEHFRPSGAPPEPRRILFIGAFQHLPNLLAVRFFLEEVWPRLCGYSPVFHIIAGARRRYFLERYRDRAGVDLNQPGIEVEDFVADVRPAYERAEVVVAPLLASAGTNIKIMEAMAMGKAIVATPAGVNGLTLDPGRECLVVTTGAEMAGAIEHLFEHPERRQALERQARRAAEERYDWDRIAKRQKELYESLVS